MGWGPGPACRHLRTSRPTSSHTEMCPFNRGLPCCPLPSLSNSYSGFVLCDHTHSSTDLVGPTCKMLTATHPSDLLHPSPSLASEQVSPSAQVETPDPWFGEGDPGRPEVDLTSQGKSGASFSIACLLGPTLPSLGSSAGFSVHSHRPRFTSACSCCALLPRPLCSPQL